MSPRPLRRAFVSPLFFPYLLIRAYQLTNSQQIYYLQIRINKQQWRGGQNPNARSRAEIRKSLVIACFFHKHLSFGCEVRSLKFNERKREKEHDRKMDLGSKNYSETCENVFDQIFDLEADDPWFFGGRLCWASIT